MTAKSIFESANKISEHQPVDRSVYSENKEWAFQRFHIAFRDLADVGTVDVAGNCKGENCRFIMCLKGKLRICESVSDRKEDFFVAAGSCCLQYHPGLFPCLVCTHQHRAQALELVCPAGELLPLVGDTQVGRNLQEAIKEKKPLHIRRFMTPAIHHALMSLHEATSQSNNGYGSLVLAKTLIVVWLFTTCSGDMASSSQIAAGTRQAVEKAQSLLEKNMSDPPALVNLAAEVGMSLSKFKQVFPRVCGVPPYTYLRRIRLERVMKLLAQNGLSVTEAALEVGYSSLSHFAKTFTAHFGIKPSKVAFEKDLCLLSGKYGF